MSTADQDLALQLDALTTTGRAKVFEDRASGTRTDRAGLQAALDYVRDGDVLVTWKLDRLGRSLPHLIDTTTPGGRLVFHLFGALEQFERDVIQERTRAALAAAAARGRTGGRKPVVTEDKLKRAQALVAKGLTVREAATRVKVVKTALYGSAEPPDWAMTLRSFQTPSPCKQDGGKVAWPINEAGPPDAPARAWGRIVGIEAGRFAYDRSGFLNWTEMGRARFAARDDSTYVEANGQAPFAF